MGEHPKNFEKRKWFLRIFFLQMICIIGILCFSITSVKAEKEKIKVGYIDYSGYIEKRSDGIMAGYGVSYLNEIAKHTNWKYEYLYDSWGNNLKKLEEGEIDLICTAQYSEERSKRFDYSASSIGVEAAIIYVRMDNEDVYYNDFEAMNGLRVGLLKESYQTEKFGKFADEKGFIYEPVYLNSENEMLEYLQDKKVDMIVTGSLALHKDLKTVAKFGADPFYFITTKGNHELLEKLNQAVEQIEEENPYYEQELYKKYYSTAASTVNPLLTRQEEEYIKKLPVLTVGCLKNVIPLSYKDEETGEQVGIYIDILEEIEKKSGLKFDIQSGTAQSYLTSELKDEKFDMVAGIVRSEQQLEDEDILLTTAFYEGNASLVGWKGEEITLNEKKSITITYADQYMEYYIRSNYPSYSIQKKENITECLDAVKNHEVDFMIHNSSVVNYYLQSPYYEGLTTLQSAMVEEPVAIAVRKNTDPLLLNILNKSIACIEQEKINQIEASQTIGKKYDISFTELVYKYRQQIAVGVLIILLITIIFISMNKKRTRDLLVRKETEILRNKAEIDPLTGLYNRACFYEKAKKMLDMNQDKNCYIITINIERFKVINELFGIEEGDRLLQHIAGCINICTPKKQCVRGRLDADNFAMCLFQKEETDKSCETVCTNILELVQQYPINMKILLRFGIYLIEEAETSVNIMCDRANLAAEKVKGSYMDHVGVYDENHRKHMLMEQEILNDMHDALLNKEFEIYIQPKYSLEDEKIIGGESLVRWLHPKKGKISPGDFIPIFEKNGFIVQLDYYVWERTCQILHDRKQRGKKLIPISVNVSRMDFYNPNLVESIMGLIEHYEIEPQYLELEITESAYTDNATQLIQILEELQQKGFHILMDDFGSGFSSLNMLKDIPVDVLKLDLKFLQGDTHVRRGEDIVTAVISMAQKLKLPVIAEGVERKEQVEFLKNIQCEYVQGYYFAKPIPNEEFEQMLDEREEK